LAEKITKTKSKKPILKTGDLPTTQSMLTSMQKQIKSNMNSLEKRLESKINQVESKINQVDSKVELVLSEIHRMAILMEEQNTRNKFVLDGYASLYERQDRLELRFDKHEKNIENLILKLKA
jgi:urate oxidase